MIPPPSMERKTSRTPDNTALMASNMIVPLVRSGLESNPIALCCHDRRGSPCPSNNRVTVLDGCGRG